MWQSGQSQMSEHLTGKKHKKNARIRAKLEARIGAAMVFLGTFLAKKLAAEQCYRDENRHIRTALFLARKVSRAVGSREQKVV